jgi:23S rRNA G2445 N2-methylase RlmL
MPRAARRYFVHVVPGLEVLAAEEIAGLATATPRGVLAGFDDRNGLVLFDYAGDPRELLELTLAEDVFAGMIDAHAAGDAKRIAAAVVRAKGIETAVSAAARVRPRGGSTYRAIARTSGSHAFTRSELQRELERALGRRFHAWKPGDPARFELWAQLIDDRMLAGFRLSTAGMRSHGGRAAELPAALKPTIARAMVLLSDARPDDAFLDPMCGTGTIALERALHGRAAAILGCDIAPEAVRAARANLGARHRPAAVARADARRLPVRDACIDVIACNLPFGRRIGEPEEIRRIYPELLREWARVTRAGSRLVLLTSAVRSVEEALGAGSRFRVARTVDVVVRGTRARITRLDGPE